MIAWRSRPVNLSQSNARGQVLLIIVLLVTVVITVGLSLAAREIVNIRLSSEEDHAKQAFTAAEAGLEQSLLSNVAIQNGSLSTSATFNTSITSVRSQDFLLNNGRLVLKDEGVDIWLSQYSSDPSQNYQNPWNGTMTIYWGAQSDTCSSSENINTMAALEIVVLTGSRNNPVATRSVYDPCGARRANNRFSVPQSGATINGVTFANSVQVTVNSGGLLSRIIPLYANTTMAVRSNPVLPEQGTVIESTGAVGDVQRKISVFRENPRLPMEFFSYTVLVPR